MLNITYKFRNIYKNPFISKTIRLLEKVCSVLSYNFCSKHTHTHIQVVTGVKVTILGFNSRADSESKTSYTHGSNWQRFRSYEFLKYSK